MKQVVPENEKSVIFLDSPISIWPSKSSKKTSKCIKNVYKNMIRKNQKVKKTLIIICKKLTKFTFFYYFSISCIIFIAKIIRKLKQNLKNVLFIVFLRWVKVLKCSKNVKNQWKYIINTLKNRCIKQSILEKKNIFGMKESDIFGLLSNLMSCTDCKNNHKIQKKMKKTTFFYFYQWTHDVKIIEKT